MLKFARAYIKSMRLYYSFVTGVAGWIGVAYYQFLAHNHHLIGTSSFVPTLERPTPPEKMLVILVILFLSWGVNQIINDYLGREADSINAPERPMVSGELDPWRALLVSVTLIFATFVIAVIYLEPISVLPLAAGVLLNFAYEYAKGHGLAGNIVFGVMISMCTMFGFYASGPMAVYLTRSRVAVLFIVMVLNGVMTFYTYFKDVAGDRAAGRVTLVVRYGPHISRYVGIGMALLPSFFFVLLYFGLHAIEIELNRMFVILALLTMFLQLWTAWLFWKRPTGEDTYHSLETNFRAGACGQAALIALFNPELGMMLFMFTYIFIGFLFSMHSNAKA